MGSNCVNWPLVSQPRIWLQHVTTNIHQQRWSTKIVELLPSPPPLVSHLMILLCTILHQGARKSATRRWLFSAYAGRQSSVSLWKESRWWGRHWVILDPYPLFVAVSWLDDAKGSDACNGFEQEKNRVLQTFPIFSPGSSTMTCSDQQLPTIILFPVKKKKKTFQKSKNNSQRSYYSLLKKK